MHSAQIAYFANSDETLDYATAKDKMRSFGSVLANDAFFIRFPLLQESTSVFLAIAATSYSSSIPAFLNYPIPLESIQCNSQKLSFGPLSDLQDSCVEVSVEVDGEGDVYLLGDSRQNAPLARTNVNEGVFLGQLFLIRLVTHSHKHDSVKTIYCRFAEGEPQSLFVTLVNGKCMHDPVRKDFSIPRNGSPFR